MTFIRQVRLARLFLASTVAAMALACSGSTEPESGCDDCGAGEREVATATVNPKSATVARGGTTNATVSYTASQNLTISGFHTQRQNTGITISQTATQGSGNNVVKTFAITVGAAVPTGTHVVDFWISVTGATNTVETTRAELTLTVTQ